MMKENAVTFHDRLKEAIKAAYPSTKAFSEATGIPYPSLRNYLTGEKKPGLDALASILASLNVSSDWLISGKGAMFPQHAAENISPLIRREWINLASHDWPVWLGVCAELAANGITPAQVLQKFRPPVGVGEQSD